MSKDDNEILGTSSISLAGLFSLGQREKETWTATELSAVLLHQLRTPLARDLAALVAGSRGAHGPPRTKVSMEQVMPGLLCSRSTAELLAEADRAGIRTFGDLISHARPPLELVRLVKDFAKLARADGSLPAEVATVLYLNSLALARVRCGQSISELGGSELIQRIEWALKQPWIDDVTRALLAEAVCAAG